MNNRVYQIKNKKEVNNTKNHLHIFILKFFIVVIVFSFGTLIIRKNVLIKNTIYTKLYKNNISFAYIKNLYNKYIGNILPLQNTLKEKQVFKEKLEYKELSKYDNGIKLTLSESYSIPIIMGGIVIFSGEKENFGNTIIIQQSNGINTWYGNLSNTNMKLYDVVEDNQIIGEAKNNELYMLFEKDGEYIDYKEVLK